MIRYSLLISTFFWCTTAVAFQQSDCLALFKEITEKAASQRATVNTKGFEMACRINITQESNEVFSDAMEVKFSGKKYLYSSKQLMMYQDDKTLVSIQHDSKVVFITKPQPPEFREKQFAQVLVVMDSLQRHISMQSCSKEFGTIKKGEGYQKIVFAPSDELKSAGLKSIMYWLHEPSKSVRKIRMEYVAGNDYGLKDYELILDKLDYNYSGSPFEGRAIEKVMAGNLLKQELKGYQLINKQK